MRTAKIDDPQPVWHSEHSECNACATGRLVVFMLFNGQSQYFQRFVL